MSRFTRWLTRLLYGRPRLRAACYTCDYYLLYVEGDSELEVRVAYHMWKRWHGDDCVIEVTEGPCA